MKLLVIEDNRALVANLFEYFEPRGYDLDAAPDGVIGLRLALANHYDAILVDWMLPRLDGRSVIERLRKEAQGHIPILMLTARDQIEDKVSVLRKGADDYLTKPFAMAELEARIEALVRRAVQLTAPQKHLRVADLEFDLVTLTARRGEQTLHLYPACRKLLEALMRASPGVVSRERLIAAVWRDDPPAGDQLRSHMHVLRRVIDGPFPHKLLHTVPRVGYRLAPPFAKGNDT